MLTDRQIRAALAAVAPVMAEHAACHWPQRGMLRERQTVCQLVAHCAHESAGFTQLVESHWYTRERALDVWPSRAGAIAELPGRDGYLEGEALFNEVYGGRMGNSRPGDGWLYRGRGLIMLTGRATYRRVGRAVGLDLVRQPDLAADWQHAWRVAWAFCTATTYHGTTIAELMATGDTRSIAHAINGGFHGLAERKRLVGAALEAT